MGVTVQGGKSLCQLLKTGSLKAAAAHSPEQAGSRICKRVSRWARAQQRCPCLRRLCKVTSDCFPFQRQPLWKELFPRGLWGHGGWVGTSGPWQMKKPCCGHTAGPSAFPGDWPHRLPGGNASTGLGPERCGCSRSESCGCWARSLISTAACLGQSPPTGQAGLGGRGKLHGAEALGQCL